MKPTDVASAKPSIERCFASLDTSFAEIFGKPMTKPRDAKHPMELGAKAVEKANAHEAQAEKLLAAAAGKPVRDQ